MDILRGPLYLKVAFFLLVISGMPIIESDSCAPTWVQYIFTVILVTTYISRGILTAYLWVTDLPKLNSVISTIHSSYLALYVPFLIMALICISKSKLVRELFQYSLCIQESAQNKPLGGKTKIVLVFATSMYAAFTVAQCTKLCMFGRATTEWLRLDWSGKEIVIMLVILPSYMLWNSIYFNMIILNVFELYVLEVTNQETFYEFPPPILLTVISNTYGNVSRNELMENPSLAQGLSTVASSSFAFEKSVLLRYIKLQTLRNLKNKAYYIPWVLSTIVSTYSFIYVEGFGDQGVPQFTISLKMATLPVLTAFVLALCSFHSLYTSTTLNMQVNVKNKIYSTRDRSKRNLLCVFTSIIEDSYPEHACIFFGFDFALVGLFIELTCLVVTTLYAKEAC